MTKEQSLRLCRYINSAISLQRCPAPDEPLHDRIARFVKETGIVDFADQSYIDALIAQSRVFETSEFAFDPFLSKVKIQDTCFGDFLLANESYARGEVFQYDEPDLSADIVIPKLGFFTSKFIFPGIYENAMPWMSACPSEIFSMRKAMRAAHGNVLVLGLGLGYFPSVVGLRDEVSHLTVVELQPEIIELFVHNILPQLDARDKITVVQDDAYHYLDHVRDGEFDFCFADIWEGLDDGVDHYLRIREYDKKLRGTEFAYWIEPQIRDYMIYLAEKA